MFPIFLRSRFNPRNELLLWEKVPVGPNGRPKGAEQRTSSWSEKPVIESTTQQSTNVDQPVTEAMSEAPTLDIEEMYETTAPELEEVSEAPTPDIECGTLAPGSDGFPWIAVLEHAGPPPGAGRKRTLSKGVLIDRQHVLTTVSSVHNSHPSWVVTAVRLGDVPTRRQSNVTWIIGAGRRAQANTLRIPIDMIFLHDTKDVALIRLANGGVQEFSDSVRPICMPQEDYRLESFKLASHVCKRQQGTGQGNGRVVSSWLEPIELLSPDSCNDLLQPYGARLPVKSFCAKKSTTDNCTGSLGGPAVANMRGKYHVVGLSSYVFTETIVDGANVPSIYVRVGGLRKWISAVIKAISE